MLDLTLTEALARRIERAQTAASAARASGIARVPGNPIEVVERQFGGGAARQVRRPRWYYHHFAGVDDAAVVEAALPWFREYGARLTVTLCPFFADDALLERLHALGLRQSGFMTATYGPPTPDEPPPVGVDVREDRAAFVAFYLGGAAEDERELLRPIVEAEFAEWRCYVALVNGQVCAGAGVCLVDGVGVMAAGGTLPAFRGRGIQTALLRRRIADAAAAGCDLIVCAAKPGSISQRNQERIGLRTAYTRVTWTDARVPTE